MLPKISVVVPSFNQARYLGSTLESILKQRYPNLEIIIMDGGSRDGSVDIIKSYEKSISYWVSQPDGGQTNALIEGFGRSTGDIQCWLNSDDQFVGDCLFEVAEYFQEHPDRDAVFGDAIWIDANDEVITWKREIPFQRFVWLHTFNYIPGMSMFWRRSIYEKVGGIDPQFQLAMDGDLWIRFAESGARIGKTRKIWSRMRYYPEQKNCRLRAQSMAEDWNIYRRYSRSTAKPVIAVKRSVARVIRIGWKLMTGCYPTNMRLSLESPIRRLANK
jgi:glycosyltransferase involved in cell wall biosynthesis